MIFIHDIYNNIKLRRKVFKGIPILIGIVRAIPRDKYIYWVVTKPKELQKLWCTLLMQYSTYGKYISHYVFERGMGVVGLSKKSKYWWINMHCKIGAFFIRFVMFTGNNVHSVVWNQSPTLTTTYNLVPSWHIFKSSWKNLL